MAQIYKIYINEVVLIITESIPTDIQDFEKIKTSEFNFFSFYEKAKKSHPLKFILISKDFKSYFKEMKRSFNFIKAAGGIVSNEENKHLFIFRNGKWDLPKGKLEMGENTRLAAIREVEEECGIRIDSCGKKIYNTYHTYELNGQRVLKETSWYRMKADKQEKLIPQIEEGITEVRWLDTGDFNRVRENTFPLIRDLLKII